MNEDMRRSFKAWAKTVDYRDFTIEELAFKCFQAGAASVQGQEPVAEVIECPTMGQQTVREIDGRWKFLKYGDLLYAAPVPQGEQCPSDLVKGAVQMVCNMLERDGTPVRKEAAEVLKQAVYGKATQPKEPT